MSGPNDSRRAPRGVTAASTPSPERIAQSTYAMWHDPTTYDPFLHGPPYLRGVVQAGQGKKAAMKTASIDLHTFCAEMCAEYGPGSPAAELGVLLAWLRAEAHVHQTHHWQTRGQAYYADHQLFERLYSEVSPMIDGVAERAVGLDPNAGHLLVAPLLQAGQMTRVIAALYNMDTAAVGAERYPVVSLAMVKNLLVIVGVLRGRMDAEGRLSIGTDNLLQDIADKHESFVYLLQQRTKTAGYNYGRR